MRPTAEHPQPSAVGRAGTAPESRRHLGRLRGAAVVVVLGGLTVGCTGNADADPSPTTTVAAEPTASQTAEPLPQKPERPAAMDRDDAAGAAAAAEYFIKLYPYVMATGDTEEFEAMSHGACGFCSDALEQAESIRENNDTWVGGEVNVEILEAYAPDELTGIVNRPGFCGEVSC
ncbi:DUF6318 family protein [Myceligenerans indicum]|uniref:DUF6318 domain-containing protein n=1 Tax=Myceligenerans indicum TaxID=2593663 RepID=A0ABS1LJ16_9MICO|nr:DUF6318 family protein [Myceligenerans indicum]MBL0886144.1 hypothetical protein [Myceligenerans indicum]